MTYSDGEGTMNNRPKSRELQLEDSPEFLAKRRVYCDTVSTKSSSTRSGKVEIKK